MSAFQLTYFVTTGLTNDSRHMKQRNGSWSSSSLAISYFCQSVSVHNIKTVCARCTKLMPTVSQSKYQIWNGIHCVIRILSFTVFRVSSETAIVSYLCFIFRQCINQTLYI